MISGDKGATFIACSVVQSGQLEFWNWSTKAFFLAIIASLKLLWTVFFFSFGNLEICLLCNCYASAQFVNRLAQMMVNERCGVLYVSACWIKAPPGYCILVKHQSIIAKGIVNLGINHWFHIQESSLYTLKCFEQALRLHVIKVLCDFLILLQMFMKITEKWINLRECTFSRFWSWFLNSKKHQNCMFFLNLMNYKGFIVMNVIRRNLYC